MDNYQEIINLIKIHRRTYLLHGKKFLVKTIYQEHTGQQLDFSSITSFREKLQRRKLCKHPLLPLCSDKNAVRSYVEQKIGAEYLIPQYFCKPHITLDDLASLPNSFVIKTTSGSGANIIVNDKSKEDLNDICRKMNSYVKIKYGYLWGEFYYNRIHNQIIAEQLLSKDPVDDYKIHCFRDNNGKLRQVVEVLWGPKSSRHKKMYDTNWHPLPYYFSLPPEPRNIPKPKSLNQLLSLAAKLSEDFNYVRVDFYLIKNHIYFGELTFIPTAGFGKFDPPKYDQIWGDWIGDDRC